ncbi:hypothetical protein GCM10010156_49380 [Planobispora rosea]|uniref:Uncharacterized protein n=1 Tax=Planobispora rosea TaxID=35762 RepID=A0A8J3WDZ3_PLARO|nr:DUF4192 family protein [Planobispora rosea]GGS84883.1 hypothetical protein GCM10010156_49380 [Planobispora rosea]GIH86449.1 hypothetical protein Pro02_48570 [Planobispora rosea]
MISFESLINRNFSVATQAAMLLAARLREPAPAAQEVLTEGMQQLSATVAAYRRGQPPDDLTIVRIGFDLCLAPIRNQAWRILDLDPETMTRLLRHLLMRLDRPLRPPALTLLAFAAWREGQLEQAHTALVTALAIDPFYSTASMLHIAFHLGLDITDFPGVPQADGSEPGHWPDSRDLDVLRNLLTCYAPFA